MAYNISEFKSNIGRYGIMPTNKFLVVMTAPLNLNFNTFTDVGDLFNTLGTERMLYMRSEQVKIPGITIQASDNKRYGMGVAEKMPHNAQFTDIGMTFLADNSGDIYRYFYSWMNKIVDFSGTANYFGRPTYTVNYKDSYSTDIYIIVYDNEGNITKFITLYKAYPIAMNEIGLDWNSINTAMKINVNFSYREYSVDNVNSAITGTLDYILGAFGSSLGDVLGGVGSSFGSFGVGSPLSSTSFDSSAPSTSLSTPSDSGTIDTTTTNTTTTGSPAELGG